MLVEQFAPPEKQHRWQIELHMLKQQAHKKVDASATKFKCLLSRVNINNFLSDDYIVRMFLSRLKNNNAMFVAIAAPKDLKEAIAAARRVVSSDYYSQHISVNSILMQLRVGKSISERKFSGQTKRTAML